MEESLLPNYSKFRYVYYFLEISEGEDFLDKNVPKPEPMFNVAMFKETLNYWKRKVENNLRKIHSESDIYWHFIYCIINFAAPCQKRSPYRIPQASTWVYKLKSLSPVINSTTKYVCTNGCLH